MQQRLIPRLELLFEVLLPLRSAQIVTGEDEQLVLELLIKLAHLLRQFILRRKSGTEITKDSEFKGVRFVRQCHRCLGRCLGAREQHSPDGPWRVSERHEYHDRETVRPMPERSRP